MTWKKSNQKTISPWLLGLVLVFVGVLTWCYVSTHDIAAGLSASINGKPAPWPPPRIPDAKSPLSFMSIMVDKTLWIMVGLFITVTVILFLTWFVFARQSFCRYIIKPVHLRLRCLIVYRLKWRATMIDCGMLKVIKNRPDRVPKIKKFESNGWSDKILIKLVRGQVIETLMKNAPNIASAYGWNECRVKFADAGYAWLVFPIKDPLEQSIDPFPISENVDLEAVSTGLTDTGDKWTVPMMSPHGANMLVAATTGGGKSGIPWSLIWGCAALIRDGYVQMWVADPKNGVEFKRGKKLFHRYADSPDDIMKMLKELVSEMNARARRQSDVSRMHEPSFEEPLIYAVVDEILAITAFLSSAKRTAFEHQLGLLLTQGRAVGINVMVLSQDATKKMLDIRSFINRAWAGRLNEENQVDMVLGDGARDEGARCDDIRVIPAHLPGVGFVRIEGIREPTRVRSCYITDAHIDYLIENYQPTRQLSSRQNIDHAREKLIGRPDPTTIGAIEMTPIQKAEIESWQKFFEDQVTLQTTVEFDAPTTELEAVES